MSDRIFSIKIKNFQSLSDADIKLEDGLTIVTGATNNGKSAIVRAVESAVFNDGTDEFIKAGTDGLAVELGNGQHIVLYSRKTKGRTDKTTYTFDGGEAQQKVGRNQLPEMEQLFNIREVRLQNNQRARLNFWYQNDKPFLMDKTAGQLYEFLSVSSSEKYLAVLRQMSSDIKEGEAERKGIAASIDTIKEEIIHKQDVLDRNRGFSVVYDALVSVSKSYATLDKAGQILESMDELQKLSATIKESLRRIVARIEAVPLQDVSIRTDGLINRADKFTETERKLSGVNKSQEALAKVKAGHTEAARKENYTKKTVIALQGNTQKVFALEPELVKTEKLLDYAAQAKKSYDSRKRLLASLRKPLLTTEKAEEMMNMMARFENLDAWLAERRKETVSVMSAATKMKQSQEALESTKRKLIVSDKELERLKREIGVCPFCGTVF